MEIEVFANPVLFSCMIKMLFERSEDFLYTGKLQF